MSRTPLLLLALALLGSSCTCHKPKPSAPTQPANANRPAASGGAPKTPQPAKADPCRAIIAAYTKAIKAASLVCKTDADCGCYSGGVGRFAGCGGVTDREALTVLRRLWRQYLDRGCSYTQNCAPRACTARCFKGKCVAAAYGSRGAAPRAPLARR